MIEDKFNLATTKSEMDTAKVFSKFGLDCKELNYKIKTSNNDDLGEIDGIFIDDKEEIIFIYDDSEHNHDVNKKISGFFNKWNDPKNKEKLIKELNLPDFYRYYIFYIDKIKDSNKRVNLLPIESSIKNNCKVFFNDEFDYFKKQTEKIGRWAKNDFYNFLTITPKNPSTLKRKAIQFYVDDVPAFVFSDKVSNILDYSYVFRKNENSENGYQRTLDENRVKKISNLIINGKLKSFPNSILINCLENIETKLYLPEDCPKEIEISLPNNFSSCRVVDGQHRLLSFAKVPSDIQKKYSLPIVMFAKMPEKDEIKTFIEINETQQSIDKNLTLSLKSKLDWAKNSREHLQKISYLVIEELIKNNENFKFKIFKGNAGESNKHRGENKITVLSFVNVLLKNKIISKNGGIIQESEDDFKTPSDIINAFYIDLINKDGFNQKYYFSNRGIQLIIKFIGIVFLNIENGLKELKFENFKESFIRKMPALIEKIKYNQGAAGEKKTFNDVVEVIESDLNIKIERDLRKLSLKRK